MQLVKAASLVLDFDLYPRMQVDSHHVGEMCEAERAGVEFPPVIADRKSRRIIDGFHRVKKQLHVHGEDAEIACVFKTYKNEQDMLCDAMRYNFSHGRCLTSYDKAHCVLLAEKFKIADDKVAACLGLTADRVQELRVSKTAQVREDGVKARVPIKRTIGHMRGKTLTQPQQAANRKLGGMNQLFYVNQLIMILENDLLDAENEDLMEALKRLKSLL